MTERTFTRYDALIFALIANPQNLLYVAKRELGYEAYDAKKGFFRFASDDLREIVKALWLEDDFQMAIANLSQEATDYLIWLQEKAPRGLTSEFVDEEQFIDTYIAAAKKLHIHHDESKTLSDWNYLRSNSKEWSLQDAVDFHEERAYQIKNQMSGQGGLRFAEDFAQDSLKTLENFAYGRTDLELIPYLINRSAENPIQRLTGGMMRRTSTLICGESGIGKTRFVQNLAFSYAEWLRETGRRSSVCLVPLEVKAHHWLEGYAASIERVNVQDGRKGLWTPEHKDYLKIRSRVEQLSLDLPIATLEKYRRPTARLARQHLDHMTRRFGGVDLIILDFARLGGASEASKDEHLRVENIYYEWTDLADTYENPDGTYPAVIIISEINKESSPPYTKNDVKYGGTYAGGQIIFLIDMYSHRSSQKFQSMLKEVQPDPSKITIEQDDMLLQLAKARFGDDGILPGFEYQGEYTLWKVKPDWERYFPSPNKQIGINLSMF